MFITWHFPLKIHRGKFKNSLDKNSIFILFDPPGMMPRGPWPQLQTSPMETTSRYEDKALSYWLTAGESILILLLADTKLLLFPLAGRAGRF